MTQTSKHIRIGFFRDFKGCDTILISVDIEGLTEIENAFQELSFSISSFDFSTLNLIDKKYYAEIKAYVDKDNLGLNQINESKFEWCLTKKLWLQFKEMSTVLLNSHNCGHQYLDAETNYFNSEDNYININSLQVILSLNEYSDSFWEKHFCPLSHY